MRKKETGREKKHTRTRASTSQHNADEEDALRTKKEEKTQRQAPWRILGQK
jgi:hypothetical protein